MRTSVFAFALVATAFTSGTAMAAQATGVVNVYHVSLAASVGRTGCIQFAGPGLPNGWGCVYGLAGSPIINLNIQLINNLLREAADGSKTCQVFWDVVDGNGFAKITSAECAPRH